MRIIGLTMSFVFLLCCKPNKTDSLSERNGRIEIEWINHQDSTFLITHYDELDSLYKEEFFLVGEPVFRKIYHRNGNLEGYSMFHNGETIGFQTYYSNGQKAVDKHYDLNGQLQGSYVMYDKSGKITVSGFYKNNRQDSIWTQFDTLGNVTMVRDKSKK